MSNYSGHTTAGGHSMMANMVNPQVMGDMISAKIAALLKITPYAKVEQRSSLSDRALHR